MRSPALACDDRLLGSSAQAATDRVSAPSEQQCGRSHAPAPLWAIGSRDPAGSRVGHGLELARRRRSGSSARPASTARLRGSCHRRRPISRLRAVQMGSWWETMTASCPAAASRAASMACDHPPGDDRVGLAPRRTERVDQLGPVARVRRRRRGRRRRARPRRRSRPRCTRSSVATCRPCCLGDGRGRLLGPGQRGRDDLGDVVVGEVVGRPSRPSAGRGRRGGSRRAARRGRPRGCAPRRGAGGGRRCGPARSRVDCRKRRGGR